MGEAGELQNCNVDKGVATPPGEKISFDLEREAERFTVSEMGIVVVPKGYPFDA